MIAYRAMVDVPASTVAKLSGSLAAHRRRIGTRKGRPVLGWWRQAVLVLRWFRQDTPNPAGGPECRDRHLHHLPVPA